MAMDIIIILIIYLPLDLRIQHCNNALLLAGTCTTQQDKAARDLALRKGK